MKVCILMGSPRKKGNTAALLEPFVQELESLNCEVAVVRLQEKNIRPCTACRTCQKDWMGFGCSQQDDMQAIFDRILDSQLLVLASPIYSWYCTPPMKAALDRLVYGMNKFYGEKKGPALWEGKKVALVTTCGYRPEVGADLWETGIRRYCKHSRLMYAGMLAERHMGYQSVFMDEAKAENARSFARSLCLETTAVL